MKTKLFISRIRRSLEFLIFFIGFVVLFLAIFNISMEPLIVVEKYSLFFVIAAGLQVVLLLTEDFINNRILRI